MIVEEKYDIVVENKVSFVSTEETIVVVLAVMVVVVVEASDVCLVADNTVVEVTSGVKLLISLSLITSNVSSGKQYLISASVKCFVKIFFMPSFCLDLVSSIFDKKRILLKSMSKF